jgi:hypothetical protein
MKKFIQIITLFCFFNSFAQTIIKVESYDEKHKYLSPRLIDENDIMGLLGFEDDNGFYNLKNLKLDSLKTYRLYLDVPQFLKIDKKLNLKNNDTLIVKLKPNPNCNCKTFPKDVLVMNCPYYSFGAYIAKEPRSLEDLPLNISLKVKNYLLSRVGEEFYKKIYFKRGQIIDSIPYKKYFKNSQMKTRYYYYLCFAYSNMEKGIGEYCSNIELDESGNIIKDIDFPKKNSAINKLVSLQEIKNKAINRKFYVKEKTKIELSYDESKNILVWKFTNEDYKPNNTFLQKILRYNAHDGKYLDLNIAEGQWIE